MGLHFDRLAMEWGDGIMNRQKVQGKIRCAEVEYGSDTWEFVTEKLQVRAVPTLQLYSGLHKLWELSGKTSTRALKEELLEEEAKIPLLRIEALRTKSLKSEKNTPEFESDQNHPV